MTWNLKEQNDLGDRLCAWYVDSEQHASWDGHLHVYVELIAAAPGFDRPQPILSVSFQGGPVRDGIAACHDLIADVVKREGTRINAEHRTVKISADRDVLREVFANYFDAELPVASWEGH